MSSADDPRIDPDEWQAQERGLRAALSGQRAGPDAPDYLRIAQAIASAPQSGPPMRFARDVAARIARHDAGIERWVSRVLLAVLAVAVLGLGARWLVQHAWRCRGWRHAGGRPAGSTHDLRRMQAI